MPKIFEKASPETRALCNEVRDEYHADRNLEEVAIGLLEVHDSAGDLPALFHRGWPASAVTRKLSAAQKVLAGYDVTITIDRFSWKRLDHDHRRALLDHELTHIQVDVEKEFPRVTLRAHDFELGGFYEVAERHRAAAPEARVQRQILVRDERGQLLLPGFEIQKTIEDELVEDEALANKLGERAAAMMREMSGPYPVAKFSEAEEGPL